MLLRREHDRGLGSRDRAARDDFEHPSAHSEGAELEAPVLVARRLRDADPEPAVAGGQRTHARARHRRTAVIEHPARHARFRRQRDVERHGGGRSGRGHFNALGREARRGREEHHRVRTRPLQDVRSNGEASSLLRFDLENQRRLRIARDGDRADGRSCERRSGGVRHEQL
jgi:hypothetical protein